MRARINPENIAPERPDIDFLIGPLSITHLIANTVHLTRRGSHLEMK